MLRHVLRRYRRQVTHLDLGCFVKGFDLLEQIAAEMAKAKGVKLPAKLSVAK